MAGKVLTILGADFSQNQIVDKEYYLALIRAALEDAYVEHARYTNGNPLGTPSSSTSRSACGVVNAEDFDYMEFVVTPKNGFKIVPLQSDGTTLVYDFSWTTEPVTFRNLSTYMYIGLNLSKEDNSDLPDGMDLWDFIDVSIA